MCVRACSSREKSSKKDRKEKTSKSANSEKKKSRRLSAPDIKASRKSKKTAAEPVSGPLSLHVRRLSLPEVRSSVSPLFTIYGHWVDCLVGGVIVFGAAVVMSAGAGVSVRAILTGGLNAG